MKEIHFEKTGGADFPKKQADTIKTNLSDIDPVKIGKLLGKTHKTNDTERIEFPKEIGLGDSAIDKLYKKFIGSDSTPREPYPDEIKAKSALDEQISSTNIKYSDAEKTIEEIRNNYPNAFVEVEEEQKQPENMMVYYPPVKVKKFDPNKLPAEVREKYQDAIAAKTEIEHNNSTLVKHAGITIKENPDDIEISNKYYVDDKNYNGGVNRETPFNVQEVTPRQQKARANMNEKVSSTGMRYVDAQQTLSEIQNKYKNNEKYQSEFPQEQDPKLGVYKMPVKKFDPYKLPEPDKTKYFEALESVMELEETNSALMQQTGWVNTKNPQILPPPNEFIKL